jgi:hypothetical protein
VEIDPVLLTQLAGASETDQLEVIVTFDEALTSADALSAAVQETGAGYADAYAAVEAAQALR